MSRTFSGSRLREARTSAGVPLELVALRVGRSAYSVQEYERGRVSPPGPVLAGLADAIGCSIDEFFMVEGAVA